MVFYDNGRFICSHAKYYYTAVKSYQHCAAYITENKKASYHKRSACLPTVDLGDKLLGKKLEMPFITGLEFHDAAKTTRTDATQV